MLLQIQRTLLAGILVAPAVLAAAQPRRVMPGQEPDMPVDAATRDRVIETTARKLAEFYVDAAVGLSMAAKIRGKQAAGGYSSIHSSAELARTLTEDIHSVASDPHTYILYSQGEIRDPPPPPPTLPAPSGGMLRSNFGFRGVEILDGNIGYIDLRGMVRPEYSAATAAAAMSFVAHTAALILDLRQNRGGDGAMVLQLCSYFFGPEPVHLGDSYQRQGNRTEAIRTLARLDGPRYSGKLFILTSSQTFSGAEAVAYNLQALKHATVVGERTAGGAYAGGRQSISDHFDLMLSIGRSSNAVTKTDWEGSGVQPDVAAPASQALAVALPLAQKAVF